MVKRQKWLERGKAHAEKQREKRREAARKEREAADEIEKKKKARLLALDINRRRLRTAPAPESAKRRFDAMRADFQDLDDNKRVNLPERGYSQQAFKVGVAGDDVEQAASEALKSLNKEEIIAGTRAQQRISMGKAPWATPPPMTRLVSPPSSSEEATGTWARFDMGVCWSNEIRKAMMTATCRGDGSEEKQEAPDPASAKRLVPATRPSGDPHEHRRARGASAHDHSQQQ